MGLSSRELAELRTVLAEVSEWRVEESVWAEVSRALQDLRSALTSGDTDAVRAAWARVEHASPRAGVVHITSAPAPPRLRELLNHLVHDLRPRQATGDSPEPPEDEASGAEERRASAGPSQDQ